MLGSDAGGDPGDDEARPDGCARRELLLLAQSGGGQGGEDEGQRINDGDGHAQLLRPKQVHVQQAAALVGEEWDAEAPVEERRDHLPEGVDDGPACGGHRDGRLVAALQERVRQPPDGRDGDEGEENVCSGKDERASA